MVAHHAGTVVADEREGGSPQDAGIPPDAERACHELLLRMAGKLPDTIVWRYRDWLAAGAADVLAGSLPKALLRHDVALDRREYELAGAALVPFGADPHLLTSALGVDEAANRGYTFTEAAPERLNPVDAVSAVIDAALRGRPDVGEVRESWRQSAPDGEGDIKRVLLVTAIAGWSRLTGELQRVLRVLGDEVPSIEVLPPGIELPDYHLAALAESRTVSLGAERAGHQAA